MLDLAAFPDLDFLLVPPLLAQSGSKMVARIIEQGMVCGLAWRTDE